MTVARGPIAALNPAVPGAATRMAPAARLRIDRFHGTKQEWDEFAAEEEPATFYDLADSAEFLSPRTF